MNLKLITALFFGIIISLECVAQSEDEYRVKFEVDNIFFIAVYDTVNFCSNFTVTSKDKGIIHSEECIERITSITALDLDTNGSKEILIETYSGGAHCCTSLYIARANSNSFKYLDTIYWGNCGFEIKDLNNDGRKEIIGCNDMFAYYFTNFAQSRFPVVIYNFSDNKVKMANEKFKPLIKKEIEEIKAELNDYLKKGFDCAKKENDKYEVFNTDAGAVQALLGAIVANYHSIGQADLGYDYVKKVYKCPDRSNFIKVLKTEFKLK